MRFAHFEFDAESDRLGEGPSSEVYRAVDTHLSRTVALKILRPHVEFDPQAKERFEREAKHTSNLAHPNIATVYEYGQDRGTSFIAMEYLEGRTLDKIIKDHTLGFEEGLRIALQVSAALGLVHERGLIHRDLKPANIMVLDDGTAKLLDFGICRSTAESNITQEGMLVGTVLYMAPEQVLGEDLDVRADVFALGSVFYHAFTGALPFPGSTFPEVCMAIIEARPRPPSEIRSGFPDPLERFLQTCLERDPLARFPHAGAAYGALLAVAEHLRLQSSKDEAVNLAGRIFIPPLAVQRLDETNFARGLRRDLSSELARTTKLEVALPRDESELPQDLAGAYVMRGQLGIAGDKATLEVTLERSSKNGQSDTISIWRERLEHSDSDEWGLQAKLVGTLVRAVKRRLAEFTLAPPARDRRDPDRARKLAKRAHETLHRGTTRHLMAAISTFRRALEEDPGCALAHAGMSEALARKFLYWDGDRSFLRDAREEARLALAYDPRCAEAHSALGFAHMITGDKNDAQREYRLAIQLDNQEWLAHRMLGALLARLGNFEGASPLLQRAIALRPTHIGSYDHLYGVLVRLDRYQEAIEIADRGISTARRHLHAAPDDQEARLHLALLLVRMGQADEAKKTVAEARRRAPKDAYTCYHAAIAFALLQDPDEAMHLLGEAKDRGYYLPSELLSNNDLDPLRGRPEFQALVR